MSRLTISIDQSTSATKAFLFDGKGQILRSSSIPHHQFYPREGWVEHDAEEIYANTVKAIKEIVQSPCEAEYSLAITNQRETVVVWNRLSGKPVCNAVVWQCLRGREICEALRAKGYEKLIREKTGLLIDPYFSASGVKWILDNVEGAREAANKGELLMGTIDSWLLWKLTGGKVHATDYTNASRTLLFNIHSLDWDEDLLRIFGIPRNMMPTTLPCDSVFGETTVEGLLPTPIRIAGILGDSHGALAGQMCFSEGLGKTTYGTGSSVMVNIGERPHEAPEGLVTSVGFAALGKVFYAFEGNIHCTGATVAWLKDELELVSDAKEAEKLAISIPDNAGVYLVPGFSGLGAPWWRADARAIISGLSLGTGRAHVCRAAIESIAYQVTDLIGAMTSQAGIGLKEIRVDGGPTRNAFLMQFQADLLEANVIRSEATDASAFGAYIMNGFAVGDLKDFSQAQALWNADMPVCPSAEGKTTAALAYKGWKKAVAMLIK